MATGADWGDARALLVVEGVSDQIAIQALAERRGIDLADARIAIVALGGAHRIARFVEEIGASRDRPSLAALCDAAEAGLFHGALGDGVYVCDEDLEDELIRALGVEAVEEVLRANGDLHRFRKLQQMPAWRGRAPGDQLRRFIAAGARRKTRYARFLVDALDGDQVPLPLDQVLAHAIERGQ